MKKIVFGLVTIFLISACNQADKSTDASTSANAVNDSSLTTTESSDLSHEGHNHAEATPEANQAELTSITWLDTQERDMGKMNEGQKLEVSFRFKNTGTKPLIISKVWAQCGCTVPETPKEPYAPGQEGVIKASFDSEGRGGTLNIKEVYVNANTDPVTNVLLFTVDVKKKAL